MTVHPAPPPITIPAILRVFALIGITGFGGVLPIAMHELVDRRRWLSRDEFAEILALCQALPGPNIINVAIVFGMRTTGWRGAAASLAGLMTLPVALVLVLVTLYSGVSDVPAVQRAAQAVASAAAGLIAAVALRMLWPMWRRPVQIGIVALVLVLILALRVPLVAVIAAVAPLGLAAAYLEHKRVR